MAKYLVNGGAGFIGSHLVEALVAKGEKVRVLDDLSTGKAANLAPFGNRVELVQASVCDLAAVEKAVAGVDCVFHEAALASVPRSVERPLDTHAACVTGTVNLLHAAQRAKVRRVVYAASSSAYGNSAWASKREIDMPEPLSPYAAAKLAAELYCQAFFHSYGLETICIRYFNVFGPRQDPNGAYAAVIPKFIERMLAGQLPIIFGDGQHSRDFTYVENVVHANLLAANASSEAAGGVYNAATGRSCSLLDLVKLLNEALGLNLQPEFKETRVGDVRDSLADISLAGRMLGYEPCVDFAEGLRRTVAYYRGLARTAT
jgi:UDP-glucose 4-epimerase